jgi:predicted acylesterase/phospholipase RssA/CRP-like cAMP-binding protein
VSVSRSDRSDQVVRILSKLAIFAGLDDAVYTEIAAACRRMTLPVGATLFVQGSPSDSLYLIERGRLGVRMQQPDGTSTDLDELNAGVSVGEMGLLTGQPRVATVYAQEESVLLQLSRESFERLTESYPDLMRRVLRDSEPRMFRTQLADALTALFGALEKDALHELQEAVDWMHLHPGEVLFDAGDVGDACYIVINGRLRATTTDSSGTRQTLGEICRGECVGELALLTGEPRIAAVHAVRETDLVRLSRDLFHRLVDQSPRAMLQIARLIARRAQRPPTHTMPQNASITFALIPASFDVPLESLAQDLANALTTHGPTLLLDAARLDEALHKPGAAQTLDDDPTSVALLGWLGQHEAAYRYVVFVADRDWSEWTRRCIRQADRLLIVGQASADPSPGTIECALAETDVYARSELLLLHPADTERPHGTSRWLAQRQVVTHHHVRMGHRQDLGRLARRLTGNAVGLVLGGGGARGFVHNGALRALAEAGIEIDMIGGTSMGALVGAAYAFGYDVQGMQKLAGMFASRKQLVDLTLPLVSFAATAKVTRLYQQLFGEVQIEDLWIPFFCIASSLSNAVPVRYDRGVLWSSVRASSAIPGIFAPVLSEAGDVLVDGGVMNNFPIDVMRKDLEAGVVIGVSAFPLQDKKRNYSFGPSISGWRVLAGRLGLASRVRAPSLFGSMMRTTELSSAYNSRRPSFRSFADLIIQPPVEQFRVLDFDSYEAIIEMGYHAAREQIAAWLDDTDA